MLGYGNFRGSGSGSSSGGFNRSGGFRSGGGFRRGGGFNRGPREMTKIKCAECGKEDEVPFKPRDGSSVLCKDCYFKSKGIVPRSQMGEGKKPEASEESENFEEDSDSFGEDESKE